MGQNQAKIEATKPFVDSDASIISVPSMQRRKFRNWFMRQRPAPSLTAYSVVEVKRRPRGWDGLHHGLRGHPGVP
jgi:hypothetical protein